MSLSLRIFLAASLVTFGLTGCIWDKTELANMKVCEALETTGNCQVGTNIFQNKKQRFYVSADLKNAKDGIPVQVIFTFLPTEGPLANQEVPLTSKPVKISSSDKFVVTSLTPPSAGWQRGKYRIEFALAPDKKDNREFVITP